MPKVIQGCHATQVQIDKMKMIARAHKTQTAAMQNANELKSVIHARIQRYCSEQIRAGKQQIVLGNVAAAAAAAANPT